MLVFFTIDSILLAILVATLVTLLVATLVTLQVATLVVLLLAVLVVMQVAVLLAVELVVIVLLVDELKKRAHFLKVSFSSHRHYFVPEIITFWQYRIHTVYNTVCIGAMSIDAHCGYCLVPTYRISPWWLLKHVVQSIG